MEVSHFGGLGLFSPTKPIIPAGGVLPQSFSTTSLWPFLSFLVGSGRFTCDSLLQMDGSAFGFLVFVFCFFYDIQRIEQTVAIVNVFGLSD